MSCFDYYDINAEESWSEYMSEAFFNAAKNIVGENLFDSELIDCIAQTIASECTNSFQHYDGMSYENALCYIYSNEPSAYLKGRINELYVEYIRNAMESQYEV